MPVLHNMCPEADEYPVPLQAVFDWHTDVSDLALVKSLDSNGVPWTARNTLRTVVIQLGGEQMTAMQVWGFKHHVYHGQGSGVVFDGGLVHRSLLVGECLERLQSVWKLALFVRIPISEVYTGEVDH